MRFWVDLGLFAVVAGAVGWREPTLSLLFLGVTVGFVGQHWRTLHLLGSSPQPVSPKRRAMGLLVAAVICLVLLPWVELDIGMSEAGSSEIDLQAEMFPLWMGVAFLSALSLLFLVNERRRR